MSGTTVGIVAAEEDQYALVCRLTLPWKGIPSGTMLDPITIISLSASTLKATYQTSAALYQFISDSKNIDQSVRNLHDELARLNRILDTISITLNDPAVKNDAVPVKANDRLWSLIGDTLNGCRDTAEALEKKLGSLHKDLKTRNIIAQSLRQLQMNMKDADVQKFRTQISAHISNLQVSLQMLNILISASSSDRVIDGMTARFETILMNQSIADGKHNINLVNRTEPSSTNPPPYTFAAELDQSAVDEETDSDDEVEVELARQLFEEGNNSYDEGRFAEAEKHLRDGLEHVPKRNKDDSVNADAAKFKLASACLRQKKWDEAERFIRSTIEDPVSALVERATIVQDGYHALAQVLACKYDFEGARDSCQKAIAGRKKSLGKDSPKYHSSVKLLATIYEANGDPTTAQVYAKKLPMAFSDADVDYVAGRFSSYSPAKHLRLSMRDKHAGILQLYEGDYDINSGSVNLGKAMMWAAKNNMELAVRVLLARGLPTKGNTDAQLSLIIAAEDGYPNIVRHLLDAGVEVDGTNHRGQTALSWAALNGHKPVVQLLIERGADVNWRTSDDFSALMDAAYKGHESVVSLLLQAGAELEAETTPKRRALHYAAREQQPQIVSILLGRGAKTHFYDSDGKTPFLYAASNRDEVTMKLLLEAGTDVNAIDHRDKRSALWLVSTAAKAEIIRLLLDHGADVDARDTYEKTPLINAADWGNKMVVRMLLEAGADPNAEAQGRTASQFAQRGGGQSLVELLEQFGAKPYTEEE